MTSEEKEYVYKWPPLESDPEIFNKYFLELGLPSFIIFEELLSLNYSETQPQLKEMPIFGIVAAVHRLKGRHFEEEKLIEETAVPFYMKQTSELDNACGLIAALHLIGNCLNKNDFELEESSSVLLNFFEKTKNMSSIERAKFLETYIEMKEKHTVYAQQGQTEMYSTDLKTNVVTRKKVLHHFISFNYIDGNLVELDGTLPGPICLKKNLEKDQLIDFTVEELKERINKGIIGDDLSVLFLTYG